MAAEDGCHQRRRRLPRAEDEVDEPLKLLFGGDVVAEHDAAAQDMVEGRRDGFAR